MDKIYKQKTKEAKMSKKIFDLSERMEKTFSKFPTLDMTNLGIELRHEISKDVKEFIKRSLDDINKLCNKRPFFIFSRMDWIKFKNKIMERAGKKLSK